MTFHNRHGFTMVELMVVIGVIVLLVAMLLPSFNAVYSVARQSLCANNLRNIRTAIASLRTRDKIAHTGALQIESWRGQLAIYDSNSLDIMVCPEGYNLAADFERDDVLAKYALRTIGGGNFLYNMILAPGPACRKENVTNGGKTYDLSFEDQRTSTGGASGDLSFRNPILTIDITGQDAKITVKGGSGGYNWHLVDTTDNNRVYLNDILKAAGARVGDSVILTGAIPLGGKFSYGLTSIVNEVSPTARKIMVMDYPKDILHIAGINEIHDNWMSWVEPSGLYKFARHKGRCNVAMVDGSVVPMYPRDIDPSDPELLEKYWKP